MSSPITIGPAAYGHRLQTRQDLAYAVLNSAFLEMRGDVSGNQLVDLRS